MNKYKVSFTLSLIVEAETENEAESYVKSKFKKWMPSAVRSSNHTGKFNLPFTRDTVYLLDGVYHREDGPAIESSNGDKHWYLNGKLHRTDGPAKVFASGDKAYHVNGLKHRADGPALILSDRTVWYLNDKLHREDGPAIETVGGNKEWWVNGNRHRVDGPAVINSNGEKHWYINGELHRLDGPASEFGDHCKMWYNRGAHIKTEYYNKSGLLHREIGPAIDWFNGNKFWYKNGLLHRDNGPAVEFFKPFHYPHQPIVAGKLANQYGFKSWYKEGKLTKTEYILNGFPHRDNGPALIEFDDNGKVKNEEFFLFGKKKRDLEEEALREV